jgi:hypothetical protein
MTDRSRRVRLVVFATTLLLPLVVEAQGVEWGVKAGVHNTSVAGVSDYYDWLLCCHPLFPNARVEPAGGVGGTAGVFLALPIRRGIAVQTEVNLSRKRHSVDLEPYEPIDVTFTRDVVEAAALLKLARAVGSQQGFYALAGPVLSFRIGESADSNDPNLSRGNPETDVYVTQLLAYSAPELLRRSQFSLAVAGAWVYRRLLVEVRLTHGLQSIFKDSDGLVEGSVEVGADEGTVKALVPEFVPFLHSAKGRDVAVLVGFRF